MRRLDLTLHSPAENLALDEALLNEAQHAVEFCASSAAGSHEVLRFWESPIYFVVLGAGGSVREDVDVAACEADGIPILRRVSGGGTVLQGPGCLNYALVLHLGSRRECRDIAGTNAYVLSRIARGLTPLVGDVAWAGISDLVLANRKVGGTAQRRKRDYVLFHGTLLYNFDVTRLGRYLRVPRKTPEYRQGRTHADFVANMPCPPEQLKAALADVWEAREIVDDYPKVAVAELLRTRYNCEEWNLRF